MKRLAILFALMLIMVIGGGLTAQIQASGGELRIPGVIRQTNDPNASALDVTPWKAEQLVIVVLFILFSPFPPGLIPMAIGIMAVMWFLDWQIKRTKAGARSAKSESNLSTEKSE